MGAQAVARARRDAGDVAVEHRPVRPGSGDAGGLDLAGRVEQAELDRRGVGRNSTATLTPSASG